jgi:non-heme chloroperoxidase
VPDASGAWHHQSTETTEEGMEEDGRLSRIARGTLGGLTALVLSGCGLAAPAASHDLNSFGNLSEAGMQTLEAPARVVVDGIELHYIERGSGEPVVLVHGSLVDYGYWEDSNQIAPLAERYRVIAYSRRYNHPNGNPLADGHSAIVEARDLAHFLDALGTGPVHLVGHSYGAYTALIFALDHPERVRSLVLGEPPVISWLPDIAGGEGIFEGFMAEVWEPMAQGFRDGGDDAGLDLTSHWYFQLPFAELAREWQVPLRNNVREWRALTLSPGTFPKLDYERVRALTVPTLLLSGGQNAGGFHDLIDGHLQRLLPRAERLIIPDASHEMLLDFPEVTAQAMLRHFERH